MQREPRRVIIAPSGSLAPGGTVVSLPHPLFTSRQYLVTAEHELLELSKMQRKRGSWLIGQSVEKEGSVYLATHVDVAFVMLPLLQKDDKRFRSLEQLFSENLEYACLRNTPRLQEKLERVCDVQAIEGMGQFLRLSEEKLLAFLISKVERAVASLQAHSATGTAQTIGVSRTLVQVEPQAATTEEGGGGEDKSAGVDLICDYVSEELAAKLYAHYGLSMARREQDKFNQMFQEQNVMHRTDTGAQEEAVKKPKKKKSKLDSVDKRGMKPMTAFFQPVKKAKKK